MTPTEPNRPTVFAVLGLGLMGHGIALNARRAALPTIVWNRSPARTEDLETIGAVVADSASEAAALADVVVTMVTDLGAVLAIAIDQGMLDAIRPGAIWVQMSTIGLGIDRVAELVAERRPDVTLIDAPVSGSKVPAEQGTLTIFGSGPDDARPRVEPFFDAVGRRTVWVGATGTGSRMKLVNNTLLALTAEGLAGAVRLARRLELGNEALLSGLDDSPLLCAWARAKLLRISNNDYSAEFSLANARKDVRLAMAAFAPSEPAILRTLGAEWDDVVARGFGDDDVTVIARDRPSTGVEK
ncbi:MAG TPA: NAD(P)-dependent oxidoreductase [Acidimicrobiia bacterium]|jgi:3-hydroxyisobutyrate dehydrogenase|nr:NAD(P)-dependent oxidoreductase [Acidimicrobiia bacterium]